MTTSADVARLFLTDVGAPVNPSTLRAVEIWIGFENSDPTKRNNPLNLHSSGGLAGQVGSANVGSGDRNVAVFDTIEHGVAADASNLTRLPYYHAAVGSLRAGDGAGFLADIAASPWSAGHYRTSAGSGNKLLNAYNGSTAYGSAAGSSGGPAVASSGAGSLLARAIAGTPASAYGSGAGAPHLAAPASQAILYVLAFVVIIALVA